MPEILSDNDNFWVVIYGDAETVSVDVFHKRQYAEQYVRELLESGYKFARIEFRSVMDSAFQE